MSRHLVNSSTSATRGPPVGLGTIDDLSPAKEVYWVLMPLVDSGPYGKGCISPGDYRTSSTEYPHYAHLFNTLATVAEDPKQGGWLIKVSKEKRELWNKTVRKIALVELGFADAETHSWLSKRAVQCRFYDPEVTDAVEQAKKVIDREQKEKLQRRKAGPRGVAASVCNRLVFHDIHNLVRDASPNPKGDYPEEFSDWQTPEDRQQLGMEQERREREQQADDDAPPVTLEEIEAEAALMASANSNVSPKFEVAAFALPLLDEEDEEEQDDADNGTEAVVGDFTRDTVKSTFSVGRDERTSGGRRIGAVLWAFLQYDDTINVGEMIETMIQQARERDAYYIKARTGSLGRDQAFFDNFQRLASLRDRDHPVHMINESALWEWVRLYTDEQYNRDEAVAARTTYNAANYEDKLHPRRWATLKNALRIAERCKVDMYGLTQQSFIEGMQDRLDTNMGEEEAIRGLDKFIRLQAPRLSHGIGNGELCQSWTWRHDDFCQLSSGNRIGIFESTFPFVDPLASAFETDNPSQAGIAEEGLRISEDGSRVIYDPDNAAHMEQIDEIREKMDPDSLMTLEVVLSEWAKRQTSSKWQTFVGRVEQTGAPFETEDVMIDNWYRKQRLEVETFKHFVHPDDDYEGYHAKTVPAMQRHLMVTFEWFRNAMRVNARINKYSQAVLRGMETMRHMGMKTITATQYLHDCGTADPNDPTKRNPEDPGLDPFAHQVLKYMRQLRQNKGVEDPLTVLFASHAVSLCYYFQPGRVEPLIVLSSPAGEGKTYVLMVLESLSVPGTTRQENYTSDMVGTAGEDVDVAVLTDEAAGIVQKKGEASGKQIEMAKATTAGTGKISSRRCTYQLNPLTGKQELMIDEKHYVHNKAYVVGTNAKFEDIVTELAARTIWFDKPKSFLPASALSFEKFKVWSKEAKNWNQALQIARFHIYKGVQNGAIPAFHDMPMVNMIFTWMRDHLRSRGIEPMEGHHENRTQAKIKQFIIDDIVNWAIAAAINTPGGICYNDELEANLWVNIAPILYPTLQVILFNVVALGHMWVSSHINHVLKAMLKVCNYNYVPGKTAAQVCFEDKDDSIVWRVRRKYTSDDRQEHNDNNNNGDNSNSGFNNRRDTVDFLKDLNYVAAHDTDAFWNSVSNAMPEKHRQAPSWIRSMVMNTAKKQMFRPLGGIYEPISDESITNMRATNAFGANTQWQYVDASRKKSKTSVPVVEVVKNKGGKKIFIATGAPSVLGGKELINAFLASVVSGKLKPRAFLIPNTHPKHRDVLNKLVLRKSEIDRMVGQLDRKIEASWRASYAKTPKGTYNIPQDPRLGTREPEGSAEGSDDSEDGVEVIEMDLDEEDDDEQSDQQGTKKTVFERKALTGEWETDKKVLLRKYGISVVDHSYISMVDQAMCFEGGREYNPVLQSEWEELKRKVMAKRTTAIKQITVDPDEWSARERWIKCGLPLHDENGNLVKIPSPAECERRYHEYMEDHPELTPTLFRYPEDEIKDREARARPTKILESIHEEEFNIDSMFTFGGKPEEDEQQQHRNEPQSPPVPLSRRTSSTFISSGGFSTINTSGSNSLHA